MKCRNGEFQLTAQFLQTIHHTHMHMSTRCNTPWSVFISQLVTGSYRNTKRSIITPHIHNSSLHGEQIPSAEKENARAHTQTHTAELCCTEAWKQKQKALAAHFGVHGKGAENKCSVFGKPETFLCTTVMKNTHALSRPIDEFGHSEGVRKTPHTRWINKHSYYYLQNIGEK